MFNTDEIYKNKKKSHLANFSLVGFGLKCILVQFQFFIKF